MFKHCLVCLQKRKCSLYFHRQMTPFMHCRFNMYVIFINSAFLFPHTKLYMFTYLIIASKDIYQQVEGKEGAIK